MRRPSRDSLIPLGLSLGCFVLALLQRPGWIVAETKVDLHVAPSSFLHDVVLGWTTQQSLGHVFAGQYGGYLWPMAPFFAVGEAIGIPAWVVGRLWLGLVLALSAWGMVRLLDALAGRPRGPVHLTGGLMFALNPYVVTYFGRTSIALLAYAALPWLLLCVHHGMRDPRGLWWPSAFALVLTSTGGGVNIAVTAWLLLGPALLVVYELGWGGVAWRATRGFLLRLVPIAAVASLWWVAAVLVHGAYGLQFLRFTEQPGTIWGTTSITESLRLMGFWTSYIGVGYGGTVRAFQADAPVYLNNPAVITATFLVPALALGAFGWTRRQRYAPFLLALTLLGLLVMFVGFPEGTPLRRGATFTYNHVQAVQFLRTTYKAGPLVALGLAGLGGLAAGAAWARLRALPAARVAVVALIAVLVALTVWPFARGVGLDRQLAFKHVPAAWKDAAKDLDRTLPPGDRAMVLPGQLFAYYDWGGTYDAILPALTDRPTAVRFIVPFSDLRSYELQETVDSLVSQQRAIPGQLRPLLDLMGVGAVVVGADDDRTRSGAVTAADAARVLAGQGLDRPARAWGPVTRKEPAAGSLQPAARLPEVREYATRTGGLVRVLPRGRETIVDGSAPALADLAAFGALDPGTAYRYAADAGTAAIRRAAAAGGDIVISDSSRRRVFVAARMRGNTGWTLQPSDPISHDGTQLDPFGEDTNAQTVADIHGVRSVRAPFSPGFAQFPEHRPFAAIDGDPGTAWLADRSLAVDRHRLDVRFDAPRNVDHVEVLPYDDGRGVVDRIAINGRTFHVGAGWNRLRLGVRHVIGLDVWIEHVRQPPTGEGGAGGISELRIPGIHATEALRPPVLVQDALRGKDLSHAALTYLFDRTTGDDPTHPRTVTGDWQRGLVRDQLDGETSWTREIAPPAARRWVADAWVSVAPETLDSTIDRWAGATGGTRFDGSVRFEGTPRNRASSAFDGDPGRAWIAGWLRSRGAWLQWRTRQPRTIRTLRLHPAPLRIRFPTRVRIVADGRALAPEPVGRGGSVPLARPITARTIRIEILDAHFPAGTPGAERQRRAVGVGEITGEGVPRATVPRRGRLRIGCAAGPSLGAGAAAVRLAPRGSIEALDAGRPLRAAACGPPVALPAGALTVRAPAAPWRLDHVRLRSPAPAPLAPAPAAGRVVDSGTGGRGSRKHVKVAVDEPAWLVYGESYDKGWRASCNGRSLGPPVPLQGFVNAWPVSRGCGDVSFAFAPNRWLLASDWVSLAACLALLVLLLARRPRLYATDRRPLAPGDSVRRLPPARALAWGFLAASVLGFVFALRAGVVLGPLVALVLWRGIGAKPLALAAGALLVIVVPVLYLALPMASTGYQTNWAVDHIAPHWVGVLAVCALGAALWRTLAAEHSAPQRPSPRGPSPAERRERVHVGPADDHLEM